MAASQESIEANIKGNVSGQVAIGNYILQVGDINGGVVNIAPPAAKASFDRRTRPVKLQPRAFPSLLDRTSETETIKNAIISSMPVSLFAESGMGKTSLLRQAAHLPEIEKFADGVVYLGARSVEVNDLLQSIYDIFFVSSDGQKPTEGQLRADLKDLHALLILDDLTLNREDSAFLLDVMPNSVFILSSTERSIWGEGQSIDLDGLPEEYSLQLFERELGRLLNVEERPIATKICRILLFHPLRILQTASMIREDGLPISEAFTKLTETRSQSPALEITLQKSNETQKKIFSLLAVSGGFALSRTHLTALVASVNFDEEIKSMLGRGFVEAQGASFSLSGEAVSSITQIWDLSGWEDALLDHFSNWLKTGPQDMLIDQAADTLFHLIKRAGEKKQWPHVVTLGRSLERIYILRKKWQGWLKILELLRMAARALADRKLEGWVLHQLGSRAMCLGLKDAAQGFLNEALNIRRLIGDKAGLAISQHNMNVLLHVPLPTKAGNTSSLRRWLTCGAIVGGAGLVAVVALIGGIILLYRLSPPATIIPTPILLSTETEMPTTTPSYTFTPLTPSITSTATVTATITPTETAAPIILFDFIENANLAIWESAYVDSDGLVLNDLTFYGVPQSPSPEDFANSAESPYVGWQEFPILEESIKDELALLSYPYYSYSEVRGTYNLNEFALRSGDRFVARVGYKLLPSEIGFASYSVTYSVSFYEKDPSSAVVLSDLVDVYNGNVHDWIVQIPKELHGKRGFFILKINSLNDTRYDWTVWVDAALIGLPR